MRLGLLILWGLVAASVVGAAIIEEDFSTDPSADGWNIFGNTNLFQWDSTNHNLRVTWDSSQTNSYFYHPLGTILTRDDDFHLSFDLTFEDYAGGVTPGKTNSAQTAIGFLNLGQATQTNFLRGTGINPTYGPKNLVEFNFFPSFATFLPTIAQVIISTNNSSWLFNHNNLLEMTPGQFFHVTMNYLAATRTLTTVVSNNGTQYGLTQTITVTGSRDFRTDTIAISCYSDHGSLDSILAHGVVDNLIILVPPPPVENLSGAFSNTVWQTQFISRSNWLYTLQRTSDFQSWTNLPPAISGNATNLYLQDTNSPADKAFYRVRAERP